MTPAAAAGANLAEIDGLVRELFAIPRSLTGDGVRAVLDAIGRRIPLEIHEVPTGTPVFDWTVPREWNLREAFIVGPDGRRIVDTADSPLHVVGYSVPVRERLSLEELRPHLFSLPDRPDWIPYRTSYYRESWGFCLPHRMLEGLLEGEYEVVIDASLADGSLTYGEVLLPGSEPTEVLVTAHICHPAQANDNVSGATVATLLAAELAKSERRLAFRFLFLPGTIGSLTWLSRNQERLDRIQSVLVLAGVGDAGEPSYKRTRGERALLDRAVEQVFRERGSASRILPFSPWGYDERQFSAPGFGLSAGLLMRTPHGTYPEYHTSADDLSFLRIESVADSLATARSILDIHDRNAAYRNLEPFGEPQLGKRGLYATIGGTTKQPDQMAILWVLNQSDGSKDLLAIADRAGLTFDQVVAAADALTGAGLLARIEGA